MQQMTEVPGTLPDVGLASVVEHILKIRRGRGAVHRGCSPPSSATTLIVRYSSEFPYLWGLTGLGEVGDLQTWLLNANGSARDILIVWDDTPAALHAGEIPIGEFVTPLDWAMACSFALIAQGAFVPLRIFILDMVSSVMPNAPALATFELIHASVPWIMMYQPISKEPVANRVVAGRLAEDDPSMFRETRLLLRPREHDIELLLRDIGAIGNYGAAAPSLAEAEVSDSVVRSLRRMWAAPLFAAGSRHDVGNLVGPLVLLSTLPEEGRLALLGRLRDGQRSLARLLRQVQALDIVAAERALPDEGVVPQLCSQDGVRTPTIDIVDDCADHGFAAWARSALFGASDGGRFRVSSTPTTILAWLQERGHVGDWSAPRTINGLECLLLDLRLWPDPGRDGRREAQMILSHVCEVYDVTGAKRIGDDHIENAYQAAKVFVDDPAEPMRVEALALLPLLIAHYDRALPVVLFSSTQQRGVLNLLEHMPNIIRDFAKPALGANVTLAAREYAVTFRRAIRRALHIADIRSQVWLPLSRLSVGKMAQWPSLVVVRSGHAGPCKLKVDQELINQIAAECRRTLISGRYADALQAPYNILEVKQKWPHQPWKDDAAGAFPGRGGEAEYMYWGVLGYLRHARAHNWVTPEDDHDARDIAVWLWQWFVTGLNGKTATKRATGLEITACDGIDNLPRPRPAVRDLFAEVLARLARSGVWISDPDVRQSTARLQAKYTGVSG